MAATEWLRLTSPTFLFPSISPSPLPRSFNFPFRRNNQFFVCSTHGTWLAQLSLDLTTAVAIPLSEDGPTELPSAIPSIITAANDSNALQTAATVLLTGLFTLFFFRSLRLRAKLAKAMRFRSSDAKNSLKGEALESLNKASKSPVKAKSPPSPDQALLGALIAAAFGVLLYKFTTSVEISLNQQTLSDNYSVRQITITIRTIINGLCYLATFVFAFNSLGLFLYSGQLALNSIVEIPSSDDKTQMNSKLGEGDGSGFSIAADEGKSTDDTY